MTESKFLLPDVGEGLTEAEIVSWRVAAGDTVVVNQILVEIETAKSLVELPSPFEGIVSAVLVEEGQTVAVGTPIVTVANTKVTSSPSISSSSADADPAGVTPTTAEKATAFDVSPTSEAEEQIAAAEAEIVSRETESKSGAVLVGYGSVGPASSRRQRRTANAPTSGSSPDSTAPQARNDPARNDTTGGSSPAFPDAVLSPAAVVPPAAAAAANAVHIPSAASSVILAKPPVRKLAKDLGVDLATVAPTGLAGDVTRDDVVRDASQASVFRNIETPEWPREREDRVPVKGVRKAIAQAMVSSAFTAPHVSVFVDVDATRTMEFVKRLKNSSDFVGVKVSPLLIMAKAMIWAVRRNAIVNSTWTDAEIIVHHFVNLGVAAATPRGLVVPNVKEAQAMNLFELASALEQLTMTARDGKIPPADMKNGTITVTNIGVFGMDTGTPILNPGEVAIVALGTIKQRPWVVDGEVRARFVTTIGASFDHRVVDGDVASRFVADVASIIEEPALLLE